MSDFLAVATVTAVLQRSLQTALDAAAIAGTGGVQLATVHVDRPGTAHNGAGLHVYLLRADRNAARSNVDLPAHDSQGRAVERPSTSLELTYLVTAFGNDATLEPHRLLGAAVARLVAHPVITDADIADAAANVPSLADTDLADAPETVRFTMLAHDIDELSRVWTVLPAEAFGPSLLVAATSVRIHPDVEQPGPPLPVASRFVTTVPANQPQIFSIAAADPAAAIIAGSELVVEGAALTSSTSRVELDGVPLGAAQVLEAGPERLRLTLPAVLVPGIHELRVLHVIGSSGVTEFVAASNIGRFGVASVVTGAIVVGPNVRVTAAAALPAAASKFVLLTRTVGGGTVVLEGTWSADQPTRVRVPHAGLAAGDHLCRLRIADVVSVPDFAALASATVTIP